MEMSQRFHLDHLQKVINTAMEGCKNIQLILDEAVKRHLQQNGSFNKISDSTITNVHL